jgi:hypothetical protein
VEITKIACNGCGAALEVSEAARFATCRFCGASLEIKRTGSAVFTEVLDRIDRNTASMAEDLGAIRREQEIERLDREWALERNGFMTRDKQGNLHEPSTGGGMIGAFVGGGFGVLWTIFAVALTSAAPSFGPFAVAKIIFPLFGVVFTIGAISLGIKSASSASQFQEAQQRYQQRRAELVKGQRTSEREMTASR